MRLSIVIPAYNEEKRIGPTLARIHGFLSRVDYDFEVIVVDDGSTDGTVFEAEKSALSKEGKLKVIKNGANKGKGFSVRNGIINSNGEYILFSDADLSTPIEEVDKLFDAISKGCDIAIGSRAIEGSDVKVRQPWYREIMGKTFNIFVKSILMNGFNDTQCGFKLFRMNVAREIVSLMKVYGFCFDVEMLYLAKMKGYSIREVGVVWNNFPESKVRLFHSSLMMFLDLLRIKARHTKTKRNK